ncbi:MAG: tetratricopeptide repeat protein [Nitrospiraceae bacterium]|nr:tetratricopeptide repeat protein [Nitrospiraceae bacterium]
MSFIIDALKRGQKARIEGGDKDKEVSAKTILFPLGNSKKRNLLSSKWVFFGIILFSFFILVLSILMVFYYNSKKIRQIEPETSAPARPAKAPIHKMHAEIPSSMESQGPDLIILPPTGPRGIKKSTTQNTPAIKHKLKLKSRVTKRASIPVTKKRRRQNNVKLRPPLVSPETATSHFNLGVSYQREGRFKKAIREYKNVISIEPFNVDAYNNLGMIYKELGDLDRAIACYKKAVSINPLYEKGHSNMAVALYLEGNLDAAVSESKKAIAINPNDMANYSNLGLIYKKSNKPDEAIESFLKALTINPDYPPVHYNLALLLEDEGKIKEAILHYQKFIKLSRSQNNRELLKKVARHIEELMRYKR